MNQDKNKVRSGLYTVAGVYLLYLAYQIFKGLGEETERVWLLWLAIVVFGVVGIALIAVSTRAVTRPGEETKPETDENGEEN